MIRGTVVVTGAGGQIGTELLERLGDHGVGFDRAGLDITDRDVVRSAITTIRPRVVVNAAAWTAVDDAESHPVAAHAVNATAVGQLAEACAEVGARLVTYSTDYVFDGTKPAPYLESDATNPQSVYGRTKLAGEAAAGPEALVLRTSWVCGFHGGNMVKTILRLAAEHDRLSFVDDQWGHPSFADDLAAKTIELLEGDLRGVVHLTNQGAVTWYEFARAVLEAAGDDPDRVDPITTAELPRPAPRPANSVLDNAVLRAAGVELLDDFRIPLARLVARLH
jgi:dTDP-4-dehydrorhamnose reductase